MIQQLKQLNQREEQVVELVYCKVCDRPFYKYKSSRGGLRGYYRRCNAFTCSRECARRYLIDWKKFNKEIRK